MRVALRIDGDTVRAWHRDLAARIAALPGHAVMVRFVSDTGVWPRNADLLFAFERRLHRLGRGGSTIVGRDALAAYAGGPAETPDLTIDLCGDAPDSADVWRLAFKGDTGPDPSSPTTSNTLMVRSPGGASRTTRDPESRISGPPSWFETAFGLLTMRAIDHGRETRSALNSRVEMRLLASILAGRAPVAILHDSHAIVAIARLGTERPDVVLAAFEDALARVTTLIVAALQGGASTSLPSAPAEIAAPARPFGVPQTGRRIGAAVANKIAGRLRRVRYQSPHWRVGWRRLAGAPDLWDLGTHPESGWTDLPDDGQRFYADPFPIVHGGNLTLFVEEFDHARRKGIISAVAFDDCGPVGAPVPVLDLPHHLSYPFVFEEDGEVWMIPESSAAGTIDLYRSTAFPGGWVHAARLVDDVVAGDATLVRHEGLWWLFATVRDHGGSYSDSLHLWSASDFRGPWTPHAKNPVLIDVASARPAGRIVRRDGALLRPVQDCRVEYGHALGLARILRLDRDAYVQVVETSLHAGPRWPGHLLHTLNAAGGFEFIDGSGRARRRLFGNHVSSLSKRR